MSKIADLLKNYDSKILLVIDDDVTMLKLIEVLFRNEVDEVMTASDPQEGLRLAMTYKPTVICCDYHMPQMTGVEVLKQLRNMPSTEDIPVVMLTGENDEKAVREAIKFRADAYLLKPCSPEDLYETLSKYIK